MLESPARVNDFGATLYAMRTGVEREFSGLLHGRRIDMITPKFLNPRIRDYVLSSAEPLYVAP